MYNNVSGAYLKELSIPFESVRVLIEKRSGALRATEILAREHQNLINSAPKTFERILRAALEFLNHTGKISEKFGVQIRPVIQFYKRMLYVTLTQFPIELWDPGRVLKNNIHWQST